MGVGEGIAMIESAIPSLLQANGCDARDVVMQLFLSGGGGSEGGMAAADDAWPSVLVRAYHPVEERLIRDGFHLATMVHERSFAPVKFTFYAASVMAHHTVVRAHGADDVLFLSEGSDPVLLEGSTFNVWVVKDGQLFTPRADGRLLSGITRRRILEWVGGCETDIFWHDRMNWDEMFLCSSVRGAVGVTQLDGQLVGNGKVGPVTQRVMATMADALGRFVGGGDYVGGSPLRG